MSGTSTIVVFVTRDLPLASALRNAVPATPVLTAAGPAQLADVLLSRACGAMLIDVGPLGRGARTVIAHLNRQFPDVPVVAVGAAADEAGVASLLAAGAVFRFLPQPFSSERTLAVIEAALKRHRELRPAANGHAAPAEESASAEPAPRRPVRAAAAQAPAPPPVAAVSQATTPVPREPSARAQATVAAAAGPSAAPKTSPAEPAAARPADPGPGASSIRPAPAGGATTAPAAGADAPRPPRGEKPAGEGGGSGRGEGGRKGGAKDAPAPVAAVATGPAPRTIAIGGAVISVLAIIGWALLRSAPPPEPQLPTAVPVPQPAVTTPGLNPIFRAADADAVVAEREAAAEADSAAARQRVDRPREVQPRADPAPPPKVPVAKLVNTLPLYPAAARSAGTEGWVDVRFTINARGMPEDVRVIAARPRGVFEPAAIEAVRSWRYVAPPAPLEATERVRFALH